jgi:hypothetical protein
MHEWRNNINRLLCYWILHKRHQYTSLNGTAKNIFQNPWSYFYNFSLVKWIGTLWTSGICVSYIDKDFMRNMSWWIFYNKHVLSKTTWNVQVLKCCIQLRSMVSPWRYFCCWSRDSVVGIATGYGVDDRGVGVRVPVGSRIFSSLRRLDRLWCPLHLLSNGYRGSFPGGKVAGSSSWLLISS